MVVTYTPTAPCEGSVRLPLSKSIEARRLLCGAVAGRLPEPGSEQECDDIRFLRSACQGYLRRDKELYLGSSGTALRFLTALCAATEGYEVTLRGSAQLARRPVKPLTDVLCAMGADIRFPVQDGFSPIIIRGMKLRGDKADVGMLLDSCSSQFLSALLLCSPLFAGALPPVTADDCRVSAAYIALTQRMMTGDDAAERDWSAASAFYLVALLTQRPVVLTPALLPPSHSKQGDSRCAELFALMGVTTRYASGGTLLLPRASFRGADTECVLDMSGTPDLVPALAVAAAIRRKPLVMTGIGHLRIKESDRLSAVAAPLCSMGYEVEYTDCSMTITGNTPASPAATLCVDCHDDHRLAMAFAPCAALLPEGVRLSDCDCVGKSFPGFFQQLASAGYKTM